MFDEEFFAAICATYGCQQLSIDRSGRVYAICPEMQVEVKGIEVGFRPLNTELAEFADRVIQNAKGE